MMDDLFEQRLRIAAQSLPTPPAPGMVIERVLAERAAGARLILPVDTRRPLHGRVRVAALFAAAAAIVISALLVAPRSGARSMAPAADSASSIGQFFVSSIVPATAFAQTPAATPGATPLTGVHGLLLGERKLEFRIQSVDSLGTVTAEGDGTVSVVASTYAGGPAWRVDAVRRFVADGGQARVEGETLYVTRADLRPLARVVHQAPYLRFSQITIRQRFTGDSVLGEMTTDDGIRRPIARRLPASFGPYLSDVLAPATLLGTALSPTWRASVSIVGWAVVPRDVYVPVTLRVVGEERLATRSGVYDCWTVHISAGDEQRTEWVRKSDGLALRSIQNRAQGRTARHEYLLLNP